MYHVDRCVAGQVCQIQQTAHGLGLAHVRTAERMALGPVDTLLKHGGVAQICLYKGFINEDAEKASLSDAIRHIDHIVDLIGINHVGIGSDFDGDGELIGCRASNELINITMRLLKEGYTENDIAKIWGGNLLRVMNKAQSAPR